MKIFLIKHKKGGNERVNAFVFSLVGWAIVVLALLFMPLGLSKKGKMIVASATLVLGEAGVLLTSIFSLWQVLLFLLLFVMLGGYILLTRLDKVLFAFENNSTKVMFEEEVVEKEEEVPVEPFLNKVILEEQKEEVNETEEVLFPISFEEEEQAEPSFLEIENVMEQENDTIPVISTLDELDLFNEYEKQLEKQ